MGSGLALAAFCLYVLTLAPTVLDADGGEFQFVPWLPGIAHPTGYPFYILLGWLWTHIFPVDEVAWRMNLLSAMLAGASVGVVYVVARQMLDIIRPETPLTARVIAAALAAALFAVSPTFWSQAVIAEVYALHALFVAGLLWLALRYAIYLHRTTTSRSGWLLAFTLGLSLTHHRTIILLWPALAVFLWRVVRSQQEESGRWSVIFGRQWFIYAGLFVAPLLLYLYLPLIAPLTPYTTLKLSDTQTLTLYDNSVLGFLSHVLGTVFTGELKPTAAGLERLGLAWQLLLAQFGWLGVGLALVGLIRLGQQQVNLLWLTGLSFAAFIAFNLIYFIGDVFVLFIPAWLLVSLWIGVGSLEVAQGLSWWLVRRKTGPVATNLTFGPMEQRLGQNISFLMTNTLITLLLLWPLILLVSNWSTVDQSHNVAARDRWQTILAEPLPHRAILLSNDRNEIMPLWYYQYVAGRRPDLVGLFPLIVTDSTYANVGRVLDQALASGRPVYLIKPMVGLSLKAELTPVGTLLQATAYGKPPRHPLELTLPPATLVTASTEPLTETIKLIGYDLSPVAISPGTQVAVTLHWQTSQPLSVDYTSYVHVVDNNGQGVAQSDARPGGDYYPSHLWQVGEILHDRHEVTLPPDLPSGPYHLVVGLYYQPQPGQISGMGAGVDIGALPLR
ncbi:MAG: DUF2723 domain-containing protein [Anaerolineae bacterium]